MKQVTLHVLWDVENISLEKIPHGEWDRVLKHMGGLVRESFWRDRKLPRRFDEQRQAFSCTKHIMPEVSQQRTSSVASAWR